MDVSKIPAGKNPPSDINVVIEVPQNSPGIKYELDKDSNAIFVDRFLATPMHYPCNYGFVPNTLSGDGDPVDVLVVAQHAIFPGAVIPCRPIGVLVMDDEGGQDEKVLAVPTSKMTPYYDNIKEATDLPQILLDQVTHFFERYKDLEKGKWVKVTGWKDAKTAGEMILDGVKRAS